MEEKLEENAEFMDKYSRQIGAFGIETMAKLVKLKVLIVGMRGVGIECAKNLILAGPGTVTIYDDEKTDIKDLGVNFFLNEDDVGTPRAGAVSRRLSELNKTVALQVHSGALTEQLVKKHNVVVFTQSNRDELIHWNNFCRSQSPSIGFIACGIYGAMGYAFTDYGKNFSAHDATGEAPITRIITDISNDGDGLITLLGPDEDGKMHEMPDSDHDGWIEISEVEGMVDRNDSSKNINNSGPYRIHFANKKIFRNSKQVEVFDPYHLKIGDLSNFTAYESGGVFTQYKKPVQLQFDSLQASLNNPIHPNEYGLMFTDGAKFGRGEQLHLALYALFQFQQQFKRLPIVRNSNDCSNLQDIAKQTLQAVSDDSSFSTSIFNEDVFNAEIFEYVSHFASIELHPLAAFFGGVIAQEIVKFTGKFSPMKQWLHMDWFEVLPSETTHDAQEFEISKPSRYDHIITMYGHTFLETLFNTKTFLVGCGALGCEYLKNFAMIGVACGDDGLVTVTDNDRIEVSNLNRQFLFRENNVGQSKSKAASNAIKSMNSSIQIKSLEDMVAPHTEHVFDDRFWNSLDLVTNALDNVKARLYVDSKCVFYKKSLVESGTLGTKCNVQVILPFLTQSYSDGPKDAPDDNIPMCTLRNFPSLIEHCIEWSRAQFEDVFVTPFMNVKKYLDNPADFLEEVKVSTIVHPNSKVGQSAVSQELTRLRQIKDIVVKADKMTFEKCIEQSVEFFIAMFRDRIRQLVHNFPEDHVTNSGEKFWSGAKRFPQSVESIEIEDNDRHLTCVQSMANILASCYDLQSSIVPLNSANRSIQKLQSVIGKFEIPEWEPSNETIAANDEQLKKMEQDKSSNLNIDSETMELKQLITDLTQLQSRCKELNKQIEPADFEKDHDLNMHIDFIYSVSNLRAWNYKIRQVSRHKCKMIAGKIIPAIATTTASVTGLAMIEFLKILQKKPLSAFKDSSNSLGLNMYLMQEPAEPEKQKDEYDMIEMSEVKCKPTGFTKWDTTLIEVDANSTLETFLSTLNNQVELNCDLLFHHVAELGDQDASYKPVSGLMLYEKNAYTKDLKALYAAKLQTSLKEWIQERYQGLVDTSRPYVEFQTSCTDDDSNVYRIPTVVCRFQ